MFFKSIMYLLAVFFAFMTVIWGAGAADMAGLASYVVITWWSITGFFALLSLGCGLLGKVYKRF